MKHISRRGKSWHISTHALGEVHVLGGVAGAACVGRQAQHISQARLQRIYIGAGKGNAGTQFVAAASNHTLGVSGSTSHFANYLHSKVPGVDNEDAPCAKGFSTLLSQHAPLVMMCNLLGALCLVPFSESS